MRLRIEREQDAKAIAEALSRVYPSYSIRPFKPKGCRLWRLGTHDANSGGYLNETQV